MPLNVDFSTMKNVGGLERILRAVFGSSLVLIDFFATLQLEIVFLILGLWGVLTSAFGYCPFNDVVLLIPKLLSMGRNTCAIAYDDPSSEVVSVEPI